MIIPLYNAEQYIGECLDSVLAQTFKNFEVIVVDDCSTDSSREIVESYIEKFSGRLKLAMTKKNSGGGGYIPRNIGLGLSRGKYIFFVDADDFIVKTALEILYAAATGCNADVVCCGAYYSLNSPDKFSLNFDKQGAILSRNNIKERPTLIENNPDKNLEQLLVIGNFFNPWTKFIRRKFLIENEICFPNIVSGGDFIWVIHAFCCSKRLLRLPIPIYFYRNYSSESIWRKKRAPDKQIVHWVSSFVQWLRALHSLADKIEVLQKNPTWCYMAAHYHFKFCLKTIAKERAQLSNQEIYEILHREFTQKPTEWLVPFLFSFIDVQQK